MILSMTAFARTATQEVWGEAVWELRSVNHRHFDLKIKLPDFCREWEMSWRQYLAEHIGRGKVDAILTFNPSPENASAMTLNTSIVEQLLLNVEQLGRYEGVTNEVKAIDLLKWPQVLSAKTPDFAALNAPLTQLLAQATSDLVKARSDEGKQMALFLTQKNADLQKQLDTVVKAQPRVLEAHKAKLKQKLAELTATIEPERLAQEWVYYAQKADIEEEITRLQTHIQEMNRHLHQGGTIGRRLDFLMQEMNREINTMASKSMSDDITATTIEMKVIVEQMREQIQNIV